MNCLYPLIRPLVFTLDPERAHDTTLRVMKAGLLPSVAPVDDPALRVRLWDMDFPNPAGLSAGFDKNAEVIRPVFNLGFGFTEVGTVTIKPQDGNPKPRVFRAPAREAIINRLGFPNVGLNTFISNLQDYRRRPHKDSGPVGVNIGMNKGQTDPVSDYTRLMRIVAPLADYITVNISSPNTPGLRDLQTRDFLLELIGTLKEERAAVCEDAPPPLLVKLAPDLDEAQQEELAGTLSEAGIDGLILTNTTTARPDDLPPSFAGEAGGLSGAPLKDKSTALIKNFYTLTKGTIPIIGVGGISTGADAYEKIKAGASLVQLYSALVFKGPTVAHLINTELLTLLQKDGYTHISEAVGADCTPCP